MTTIADIQALLTALENRAADDITERAMLDSFNTRLADIAMSLADAVRIMEAPEAPEVPEPPPDFSPIVAAIDRVGATLATPDSPDDYSPLVAAIDRVATRPMVPGWDVTFTYSQVNGKITGMQLVPLAG